MEQHLVYLASGSPRRRELLRQIGVAFETVPAQIDESALPGETPAQLVVRLALEKAGAAAQHVAGDADRVVIGADTVVVVDDTVMGKPVDRDDALAMLERLSGRSHLVLTAVAGIRAQRVQHAVSSTTVTFRKLTHTERVAYVDSGEPDDKAGAYAIQGRAALFIERIDGSYSGVMGLPLYETGAILVALGAASPAFVAVSS